MLKNQNLKKNSNDEKRQPNFYNSSDVKKEVNESMKFNILKKYNLNSDNLPQKYENTNQYKIHKKNNTNSLTNMHELNKNNDSQINLSNTINSANNIQTENKKISFSNIINQRHRTNWNKPINQIFLENNSTYPLTKNGKTNFISDEYIKYQNWINNNLPSNNVISNTNNLLSNNASSNNKLMVKKEKNKIYIDNINEFKNTYRKNNNRSYFPGNNTNTENTEIQNYVLPNDFNPNVITKTTSKTKFIQMYNKKNQYKTIN